MVRLPGGVPSHVLPFVCTVYDAFDCRFEGFVGENGVSVDYVGEGLIVNYDSYAVRVKFNGSPIFVFTFVYDVIIVVVVFVFVGSAVALC